MSLSGKKIITFADNLYNDLELWYPVYRLREAGATVHIAGPEANATYIGQAGLKVKTDLAYDDVNVNDYDGVHIPGGYAPDKFRQVPAVIDIVKKMNEANKPIAHICHAGWVLVSADILKGKKSTSTPAIQDDMKNAGAEWVNEEVVVDGNIISSRRPDDLPAYMKAFIEKLAE